MSFFVTSIAYYPDDKEKRYNEPYKCTRTFGHFGDLARAQQAVNDNECNMCECLYNYLVVEEVPYGIHASVLSWDPDEEQHQWWYQFDDEKNGWVPMAKPEWSKHYISWASVG